MLTEKDQQFNESLVRLAKDLDISPSKYREAVDRHRAVGTWLDGGSYPSAAGDIDVYVQGSFRLGTVVRPLRNSMEGDYDIDLVCQLPIKMTATTAESLKQMVGDRLKENNDYRRMLDEEGRRCWTLQYAESDGVGFHLDVLPSIATDDISKSVLHEAQVLAGYYQHAIEITDKDKETDSYRFAPGGSNPRGYALWFDARKEQYPDYMGLSQRQKQAIFENTLRQGARVFASVDDVPEPLVRTPLQRVIQILKRHRDTHFKSVPDDKPMSMIITTLAACAYEGEPELYSALTGIIAKLTSYEFLFDNAHDVSGLIRKKDGQWWIPNPVNPLENFADRWNDPGSNKPKAFFEWLAKLNRDVDKAISFVNAGQIQNYLWPLCGKDIPEVAAPRLNIVEIQKKDYPTVTMSKPNKPWGLS